MNRGPMRRGRTAPPGNPREIPKGTVKRLAGYIFTGYRLRFTAVVVCILLSALAGVAGSMFLEVLIDDYITPLLTVVSPDFSGLLRAVLIMAGVYLIGMFSSYLYNITMVSISQGVLKRIRDEMFAHMQTLPVRYFDTHTNGNVMSYYTNDTDTLRQMIAQSLPQGFSSAITIIAVLCAMIYTSWQLTLILFAVIAVMVFVSGKITGKSAKYFIGQQKSIGSLNGYIEEMVNGQKVVKVFCHEAAAKDGFDDHNFDLRDNAYKANKYANILMPILGNLGNLQYVILAVCGGAMALSSGGTLITLGGIAAFLQLSKSFTMPINQMTQQLNSIIMALAGAGRIFGFMDEKSEEDGGYVTLVNSETAPDGTVRESTKRTGEWAWRHPHEDGTVTYTPLRGDVRLIDVDFEYEASKPVLHDISIYAEPGQKVAFVGATGAGKTTITNLINRFYDLADGKVRYDGININKIKKDDLRRSLGVVLQDTNLFTGTVMENIRYGKTDATDDEVIAAAKLANAHGFIERLPDGYGTMLTGNGANLSQGQRQLISIARAAVADPPVMILDEATSSIDTRTEVLVQRGMDSLMHGRTVFVIAHRLSTIRNSDVIMVLDAGRIIERGDHKTLMAQRGRYYQLYTGMIENN